jgi:hypothetical protein
LTIPALPAGAGQGGFLAAQAGPGGRILAETPDDNAFNFVAKLDVLNLCGNEARRWLKEFQRAENFQWATCVFQAMVLFRRHENGGAVELLKSVDAALAVCRAEFPSIVLLLRRWHHSAMAYFYYLEGDLEAAKAALLAAHETVSKLLSLHSFLIPIATHCIDFRIQLARIARRENRWAEVKRHINTVRLIYSDRHPFCVLESGKPIRISDLREFYLSLPLSDEQKENVRFALEEDYPHHDWIDRLEENIFALPDFVIPYP